MIISLVLISSVPIQFLTWNKQTFQNYKASRHDQMVIALREASTGALLRYRDSKERDCLINFLLGFNVYPISKPNKNKQQNYIKYEFTIFSAASMSHDDEFCTSYNMWLLIIIKTKKPYGVKNNSIFRAKILTGILKTLRGYSLQVSSGLSKIVKFVEDYY